MKTVVASLDMNIMKLDYPVTQQTLWERAYLQQLTFTNFPLTDPDIKFIPYSMTLYNYIQNYSKPSKPISLMSA
jgi:hypothetical protein